MKIIMNKDKFIKLLGKSLGISKISESTKLHLDSLNLLQLVELNNKHFKDFKLNSEKTMKCSSVKDLVELYKKKVK